MGFVKDNTPLPAAFVDAKLPQGLPGEVTAADINAIWAAAGDLRTQSSGWVNVKNYGAVGDGVTNDTTAVQTALNAAQATGQRVYFPAGIYLVSGLTISGSVSLFGEGMLRMRALAGDLLTISGTSTVVRISDLGFDGNEAAQAFESGNRTIVFAAIGTATVPAGLEVEGCTFVNGTWADIRVHGDGSVATSEWVRIIGNTFLGGREGTSVGYDPRYVDLSSPADYVVEGNLFDRLAAPSAFGRAGIVAYDGFASGVEGRGSITGNTLVQVGRSNVTSTLGSIDCYSRGRSLVISGNSLTSPVGRGINVKAESKAASITGNAIDGLIGGSDGTIASQIVLNASVTTDANGPFVISGNALTNSGLDGISITAKDSSGLNYAHGVLVTGNTIKSAGRRGIGIAGAAEVSVTNNNIYSAVIGIHCDAVTTALHVTGNLVKGTSSTCINVTNACTTAYLNIAKNTLSGGTRAIVIASGTAGLVSGNVCTGQSISGVDVSGTTGAMRVTDNVSDNTTPFVNSGSNTALHVSGNDWTMGSTAHALTISGGVVTATMEWHYVDTEGASSTDDLDTINGGYDGAVITLRQLTAGHTVVIRDGTGNLRTTGDFALDSSQDSITFRWCNDAWIENARSDNATTVNAVNITSSGQSFTPSMKAGTEFIIASITGVGYNYTVNAPIGATSGRFLTVRVKNTSGGIIGVGTWNAIYKLAGGWNEPANAQAVTITFLFDGTNWVEVSRSGSAGSALNVKDFAATGDGTTNDSAALQAAITAAVATNAWLLFPPGTYNIAATGLTVPAAATVRLSGVSRDSVTLLYSGSGTALSVGTTLANTTNVVIEGIKIDVSAGTGANGLRVTRAQGGAVRDVYILGPTSGTDAGVGLEFDGTGNWVGSITVDRVRIQGNWTKGFYGHGPAVNTCNHIDFRQMSISRNTAQPGTGTIGFHWDSTCGDGAMLIPDVESYDVGYQVDGRYLIGVVRAEANTVGVAFGASSVSNDLVVQGFANTTPTTLLGTYNCVRDGVGVQSTVNNGNVDSQFNLIDTSDHRIDIQLRAGNTAEQQERLRFLKKDATLAWQMYKSTINDFWFEDGAGVPLIRFVAGPSTIVLGRALVALRSTPTYGVSVAIDAKLGNEYVVTPTDGVAFTVANPTNATVGQRITLRIKNTFGTLGALTFGNLYKAAAWTQPANGFSRAIDFQYDGTNWVEVSRTPADVPN